MGTHREGSLATVIVDILESNNGDWYNEARLFHAVLELRPNASERSIRRTLWRLINETGGTGHAPIQKRYVLANNQAGRLTPYEIIEVMVPYRAYLRGA